MMPESSSPVPDDTRRGRSASHESRRSFLKRAAQVGTMGLVASWALAACGGESGEGSAEAETASFSCTDTSGLTDSEMQVRQAQQYVDKSPNPEEVCDNCNFWQTPEEASTGGDPQCGGCQVVKGPIHPQGYCNLWAEQQSAT